MSRMRVYELAKEIDMDSRILVARLIENGINVKNYMTMLDEEAVEKARAYFRSKQGLAE